MCPHRFKNLITGAFAWGFLKEFKRKPQRLRGENKIEFCHSSSSLPPLGKLSPDNFVGQGPLTTPERDNFGRQEHPGNFPPIPRG